MTLQNLNAVFNLGNLKGAFSFVPIQIMSDGPTLPSFSMLARGHLIKKGANRPI